MSQSRKTNFIIDQKELPRPPTDHQGPCSTTRYWVRKVSIALWLWEFASLFLSTLCMGTIGVILIQYNNRPIAVWSYGLTMNGVIFILAVIAKSSLILPLAEALSQLKWCWFSGHQRPVMDFDRFDLAGRGPMGSLAMLAHLRFWRGIGALGAALTVCSLAVKPFLQQIPSYPVREVVSGRATVPVTHWYDDIGMDSTNSTPILSPSSRGAVYNGVFSPPASESARDTPTCATGNCTWPNTPLSAYAVHVRTLCQH